MINPNMQVNEESTQTMLENTLTYIKCSADGLFNHPHAIAVRSLNNADETADHAGRLMNNPQLGTGGNVEQSGKNVQRFTVFHHPARAFYLRIFGA